METMELAVTEEAEEMAAPVDLAEQEMDVAAFRLWQEASRVNPGEE